MKKITKRKGAKATPKNKYLGPNYRVKKFEDNFLITADHGAWIILNQRDYKNLKSGKFYKNLKFFRLLEDAGIILTENNLDKIIEDFRLKNSFLFQGTALHIVVPTLRCNMKCSYCHASSKPTKAKKYDMSKKTAKKVVDFIFQGPSENITIEFQGGEPLLKFDIVKFMIDYANKVNKIHLKNLRYDLVTNLTLMNKRIFDYLMDNKVGICTSLDGFEKIHNAHRKFPMQQGSYKKTVEWIKKINKGIGKGKVNALMTVTKDSLKYPKKVVDEYIKNGLNMIHLRELNNLGYAKETWKMLNYSDKEFIEFWKKAMEYIIKLNKQGREIKERTALIILQKILTGTDPGFLDLRSPCGAAIGQLVYNYDGNIYTCDEGRMIGEDLFRLGNVKKNSYKEVLTSEQACSIISASVNDVFICDDCVYKPYCGLCPVCNYAEQGSIVAKIPETNRCKIKKAQFDYIFDKLLNDKEATKIFLSWIKNYN